ncbi:MAG TPA: DNA polymerase IV [Candidatus Blautia merdigallinarum]|uniref:DNA polymerase IV n=1 Tax=Candidatus Blautia merdigallinarum TaxID=2838495 RepID=A0A9D2N819_9FIRM|nr:DNA polymerase IV [Candidatus Blautia merdigallinarum]
MEKVIFHIDVNSAYLSWEAVYRLREQGGSVDLREIPCAVGGDKSKRHGIILAKSLAAKACGVRTGEPLTEALKKCPGLTVVPAHHSLYRQYSKKFMDILREYTPDVQQYSIDEAFMDMSGMEKIIGDPVAFAHKLKNRISRELGFTVNVGISSNKYLAKMASDFEKPDKVHTLFPEEIPTKMWPLPVSDLIFVGRSTQEALHKLGIYTIGQLAATDVEILRHHLKKQGETIWEFANGRDSSLVEPVPEGNKMYGNSTTVAFDITDEDTARMVLLSLSETVASRLREDGQKAQMVSVSIRNTDMKTVSHQKVMPAATDITEEIYETACQLFEELWDQSPIRLLGVQTGKLSSESQGRQMSLFDNTDYEKMERMDQAVDKIRKKYGKNAIMRASFLDNKKVDHMTGGHPDGGQVNLKTLKGTKK